jgi:hypothetical protein
VTTTAQRSGLLEKLIVATLFKKFPAFYGTIIMNTTTRHLTFPATDKFNVHPGSQFSKDIF